MPAYDPWPAHAPVSEWSPHLFKQAALFIKRAQHVNGLIAAGSFGGASVKINVDEVVRSSQTRRLLRLLLLVYVCVDVSYISMMVCQARLGTEHKDNRTREKGRFFVPQGIIGGSHCPVATLFSSDKSYWNVAASLWGYYYGELARLGTAAIAASQLTGYPPNTWDGAENGIFVEFSLCLSRACLGKIVVFIYKWLKNAVFRRNRHAGRETGGE
jgi:hypothetical protein